MILGVRPKGVHSKLDGGTGGGGGGGGGGERQKRGGDGRVVS